MRSSRRVQARNCLGHMCPMICTGRVCASFSDVLIESEPILPLHTPSAYQGPSVGPEALDCLSEPELCADWRPLPAPSSCLGVLYRHKRGKA